MKRKRAENAKSEASASFACQTKYPLVLVHGTGFRDRKLLNYWGRVPKALIAEGAQVFYSHQDAWGSIANNAKMVKGAVEAVLLETGADKVNLLAHSKGGLDARYMISVLGMADKVASLTTISTPHHGMKTMDFLQKMPKWVFRFIGVFVNLFFKLLGDERPDFYRVCRQFRTSAACVFNEKCKNGEGVYYQSYASSMQDSLSDIVFVISHGFVKRFDGANDGLVSVESSKWGRFRGEVKGSGRRGISHGDVVDMRRRDIRDVDIRGLYVGIVRDLRDMGF